MSALEQRALARARPLANRQLASAAGLALAASVTFLARHIAPGAPAIFGLGLSALAGLAIVALALTLEGEALPRLTQGALAGGGLALTGALLDSQDARLKLFSLAMAALAAGLAIWLVRTASKRPRVPLNLAALYVAALAALIAYATYIVIASRDLMTADFMTYRNIAIMVARLADFGNWPLLMIASVESITQDYSWFPALFPSLALALTGPFSRAVYSFAILALYAGPAAIALAILARDLASRARIERCAAKPLLPIARLQTGVLSDALWRVKAAALKVRPDEGSGARSALGGADPSPPTPLPQEERGVSTSVKSRGGCPETAGQNAKSTDQRFNLAFGLAAVVAAYPAGMAVAARGMPDVGGLVLVVVALRLADHLARLLALRAGHDLRVARMTRRVAVAMALTMFAMFAFRRWYAFAAFGVGAALAFEIALIALKRGRDFRWREATSAAALGALTLLALSFPLIVDWLPNLGAHDYASAYAAYRKPTDVFLSQLGDWVGLLPALAALGCAAFLWALSPDRRLLRLALGGAAVAALLFLRVQTPYIHHLYLIAPALMAPVAATLMMVFARRLRAAVAALAGLFALTLSPLAAALNPLGLTPIAGLPRAPRADLAELERMKDWVDARALPGAKVCGLGSSYTFSGQLIGELWQLHPERQTLDAKPKTDVMMSDVDTVEGPPAAGVKDCTILIVGDPVQTHLNPDYQQTVIVPSREMLAGQGIGAKFRRTGEVFHLEKGVSAVVFERIAPIDDSDIAALRDRWRAARASPGFDGAERQ